MVTSVSTLAVPLIQILAVDWYNEENRWINYGKENKLVLHCRFNMAGNRYITLDKFCLLFIGKVLLDWLLMQS